MRHYLILRADRPQLIHHAHGEDGAIVTRVLSEGPVTLAPPGITIEMADIYR